MPDKLISVKADTANDFLDNAHKAMKSATKLGETKADVELNWTMDSKTKKIKSATFSLKTTITRVHWAGKEKTDPDAENQAAIDKIEALNKAHEEAHQDGYTKAFKACKAKLEKEAIGKTEKEAKGILDKMNKELRDACETLHKSGGKIDVSTSGGKITVTERAEGPGGCS